jgi:hypothetical protein
MFAHHITFTFHRGEKKERIAARIAVCRVLNKRLCVSTPNSEFKDLIPHLRPDNRQGELLDMSEGPRHPALYTAALTHPAIDNHAHPLLRSSFRSELPFEGVISEAEGAALTEDAPHTLACFRATRQLARLFGLAKDASWEDVKRYRDGMDYEELCRLCFENSGIEVILIDDGLGGVSELAEGYQWHDRFTKGRTRRIVRVEIEAEVSGVFWSFLGNWELRYVLDMQKIMKELFDADLESDRLRGEHWDTMGSDIEAFQARLRVRLEESAVDPDVVGFKSIVCYRTGLDVHTRHTQLDCFKALEEEFERYRLFRAIRLAKKPLNDYVVALTLEVAAEYNKPGERNKELLVGIFDFLIKVICYSAIPYRTWR